MSDVRDTFIRQVVRGKTFADVGGLWGTVSEKVSVARSHRATALTMIDSRSEEDALWQQFRTRLLSLGIAPESVIGLSADAHALGDLPYRTDVVHCSGVIYHSPEPTRLLLSLRKFAREYLILTSTVVPAVVRDAASDGWIYIPALGDATKRLLAEHWRPVVGDQALGITAHCAWNPADFDPWWWLPTIEGLKRRCASVGFTVIDEAPFWDGNAHTLLLT